MDKHEIYHLLNMLQNKDMDTGFHSLRVSKFASELAMQLKMTDKEIEVVKIAGLLHDIGKIKISSKILLKPGSLSESEYEEIKRHPILGVELLAPFQCSQDVLTIIREHHERIDGSGYPDRLKGENISIGAKIIAVADSYDAMISDRKYKKRMDVDSAIKEIRRGSSTQFDECVVNAFLMVVKEVFEEKSKQKSKNLLYQN